MNEKKTTQDSIEAVEIPAPQITMEDLEPESDVTGGVRCQNNLKQLGIA